MVEINDLQTRYNCKIVDYSVGGASVSDNYFMPPAGFFPAIYSGKVGLRQILLTLEFKGSPCICERSVSDLIADLMGGMDLLLPDGFWYRVAYSQDDATKRKGRIYGQHQFRLMGVRHDALITKTLITSGTVVNPGNRVTPCRLTLSGITGTVTVFGITLTGLTGEVVIDGIAGTVKQGNNNVFGNTDLTEFPKLQSGVNSVTVPSDCTLKIEFYPLYW